MVKTQIKSDLLTKMHRFSRKNRLKNKFKSLKTLTSKKNINNNQRKLEKEKKQEKKYIPLKEPIKDHYFIFQKETDLYTLLYTSIIFKWINTDRLIIICNTSKIGYHIDLFLRNFNFSSTFLDREMPLNTNNHFYNQYMKGNFPIIVVNNEYSSNSENYAKKLCDHSPIMPTIIFFNCFDISLLEYLSYHPNVKSIYHFIIKQEDFVKEYNNLDEKITFSEFKFDFQQMEHLRYRCEDIFYGIKKSDIKKEKARKINIELLHSKQMEKFFEENPKEKKKVIQAIEENSIKNLKPSVSYLPSYLIHEENNIIADAINNNYQMKKKRNKRRHKKGKMESYFEALEKGDGSHELIKF